MSYSEHRKCDVCKTTYLNGTPHNCATDSVDAGRAALEEWLVDYQVEDVDQI